MSDPYQPPGAGATGPTDARKRLPVYSLACAVLAAVIASLVVPPFRDSLASYGAELPWLTRVVFAMPHAFWLLPVLLIVAWRGLPGPRLASLAARVLGIGGLLVLIPVLVIALYLPIFRLAATVG